MPDANGYVSLGSNNIGIQGAWYAYGDDWGITGAPPGNCEKALHPPTACSQITSPPPAMPDAGDGGGGGGFPNTNGMMCLSGTAAKVIGTPPDYSNIFGIGIGLDFNNVMGVKSPWDSTGAKTMGPKVIGFSFTITGFPTGAVVRVEFPTPITDPTGDSYQLTISKDGTYRADLTTMMSDPNYLKPAFNAPADAGMLKWDPTQVESIQFHVVTDTTASHAVMNFCVSNLTAITM
jgi:hypothetical protein